MKSLKMKFMMLAASALFCACNDWTSFSPTECNPNDRSIVKIENNYYQCTERGIYTISYPECIDLGSYKFKQTNNDCERYQCKGYEWQLIKATENVSCMSAGDAFIHEGTCLNGTNSCQSDNADENTKFEICINGQYLQMSDNCGCNSSDICTNAGIGYGFKCENNLLSPCHNNAQNDYTSCINDNECGECLNNSTQCQSNKLQTCHDGQWETTDCPNGCDPVTNQCKNEESDCKSGEKKCDSKTNTVLQCNNQNQWTETQHCEGNQECQNGVCINITKIPCTANDSPSCLNKQTLKSCKNGTWTTTSCQDSQTCISGSCVEISPECSDKSQCEENQICDNGKCVEISPECSDKSQCKENQICDNGKCVECINDTVQCKDNNTIQTCQNNKWKDDPCEGKKICDNGKCVECLNDTVQCKDNNTIQTCDNNKWKDEPCKDNMICDNGICVECLNDTVQCKDDNTIQTCQNNKWKTSSCGSLNVCVDGICVECKNDTTQCKDDHTIQTCQNNKWKASSCGNPNVCVDGICVECKNDTTQCKDDHTIQTCQNNKWVSEPCQNNQICNKGNCRSLPSECTEDAECGEDYVCFEYKCKPKCNCFADSCEKQECSGKGDECIVIEATGAKKNLICLNDYWYAKEPSGDCDASSGNKTGDSCGTDGVCFAEHCVSTKLVGSSPTRCFGEDFIGINLQNNTEDSHYSIFRCNDQIMGGDDKTGTNKKCVQDYTKGYPTCKDKCTSSSEQYEIISDYGAIACDNQQNDTLSFYYYNASTPLQNFSDAQYKFYCLENILNIERWDREFYDIPTETIACDICDRGICYTPSPEPHPSSSCIQCDYERIPYFISSDAILEWCQQYPENAIMVQLPDQSEMFVHCLEGQHCVEGECVAKQ